MTQILQPGDVVAWSGDDPAASIDDTFANETWQGIWPRLCYHFASTGERDAALAGLAPTDSALAYVRDLNVLFAWNGTAWKPVGARRANGSVAVANVPAVSGGTAGMVTVNVTFPTGLFTAAPRVSIAVGNTRLQPGYSNLTSTGVTLSFANYTGGAPGASVANWIAEQL